MNELYVERKLHLGYPNLEKLSPKKKNSFKKSNQMQRVELRLKLLNRLVDLSAPKNVLVLGCGPRPEIIKILREKNYNAVGVEPVPSFVRSAMEYLSSPDLVLSGAAEKIPLDDSSQHLVILESVLEHVDSPTKSLNEIFRILVPGGVVLLGTTNRYKFSLTGENGEYNVRYFNWFPNIVKECYVHHHLHYDPSLANYSTRPGVHWFSYSDLCRLGREAGFAKFYSPIDLLDSDDAPLSTKNKIKVLLQRKLINWIKFNPWLRAIALTQLSGTIIMLKRHQ